jgi:hypothetical protein
MPVHKNIDQETLEDLDSSLTEELEEIRGDVLDIASDIVGRDVSVQSLHGFLGGKNNAYVDSIRSQFPSPKDFISKWMNGLLDKVKRIENEQRLKYNGNVYQNTATHRIIRLLKEDQIFEYLIIFLKRNFYRNLIERTRAKPDESHWAIWFGENQIPWGLIIAPAYRKNGWTNDVSEIRRADYMYWTVEHVLTTGLIDPDSKEPVTFSSLNKLIQFYSSVLKRLSRSKYEKQIVELYLEYLEEVDEPGEVPFLIPELRYAGLETKHRYRLDFSVLNSHTMEFMGFELSPQSIHMSVSGVKGKKQKELNEELKAKWNKEVAKRNKYFQKYDIITITFADEELEDIDECFSIIEEYLSKRPEEPISYEEQIQELEDFEII